MAHLWFGSWRFAPPPTVESRDTKLPAALEVQVHLGGISRPDVTWGRGVSQAPPQPAGILGVRWPEAGLSHGPGVDGDLLEAGPGQVGALGPLHHEHLGLQGVKQVCEVIMLGPTHFKKYDYQVQDLTLMACSSALGLATLLACSSAAGLAA